MERIDGEADLQAVTFCIEHNHTLYILYPLSIEFWYLFIVWVAIGKQRSQTCIHVFYHTTIYCLLFNVYTCNVYRDPLISWG